MKKKMEIRLAELRAMPQQDENEDLIVEGYALIFDSTTVLYTDNDGIQYKEVIRKGALDSCDLSDVVFRYNHSSDVMIMARTKNNTLQLMIDDKGLKITANLAKTTTGKDLFELIRRGDVEKMSMAMFVTDDNYDRLTHTRTIFKISKLGDVSAVDVPAYDATNISVRNYFDAQEEMEQRIKQQENLRKKILIKTYL